MNRTEQKIRTTWFYVKLFSHQPSLFLHVYGMSRNKIANQFLHALGLTDEELQEVKTAVWLHDAGKIKINTKILNNPKALTDEEYAEIKEHATFGADVASQLGYGPNIVSAVQQHHERLDGSGYPAGLIGEQIEKYARIVAILDCFDVMRRGRVYKGALTKNEMIDDLKHSSMQKLDPIMTHLLIGLIEENM